MRGRDYKTARPLRPFKLAAFHGAERGAIIKEKYGPRDSLGKLQKACRAIMSVEIQQTSPLSYMV